MEHGVNFNIGGIIKHSNEFGLVFMPFEIPAAEIKKDFIEIEGADGTLDFTEAFGLHYNDLNFSLTFTVLDKTQYSEFKSFIHGRRAKITIYSDEYYYYDARCEVSELRYVSASVREFDVNVIAKPYRYYYLETIRSKYINGTEEVFLMNKDKMVCPKIKCDSRMQIEFENITYTIDKFEGFLDELILKPGSNKLKINGNGNIVFSYREGKL